MAKKSREKGISFTYNIGCKVMHCGIKTSDEYERWNHCTNPLAPKAVDVVDNVYVLGVRRKDLDGKTSEELKSLIENPFID